jgi:hypothetical protein
MPSWLSKIISKASFSLRATTNSTTAVVNPQHDAIDHTSGAPSTARNTNVFVGSIQLNFAARI